MKLPISKFESAAETEWHRETAEFLAESFPKHFTVIGADTAALERLSEHVVHIGRGYNIRAGNHLRRLAVAMVALGADLLDDPRFWPDVRRPMARYYRSEEMRINAVAEAAKLWNGYLWVADSLPEFGARVAAAVITPPPERPWPSAAVLPAHAAQMAPELDQRFRDACHGRAADAGITAPQAIQAHHHLALVHGLGWLTDPQHVTLQNLFAQACGPRDLSQKIEAFYQGFAA
ncbi:MAG: hypothetical protein AB8B60_10575 [Sulfitobacter sp.]